VAVASLACGMGATVTGLGLLAVGPCLRVKKCFVTAIKKHCCHFETRFSTTYGGLVVWLTGVVSYACIFLHIFQREITTPNCMKILARK